MKLSIRVVLVVVVCMIVQQAKAETRLPTLVFPLVAFQCLLSLVIVFSLALLYIRSMAAIMSRHSAA